jgi:hypothetical protein
MLAALAALAKDTGVKGEEATVSAAAPSPEPGRSSVDESVLEAAMDEFRRAPDSRAALRSLRALITHLR